MLLLLAYILGCPPGPSSVKMIVPLWRGHDGHRVSVIDHAGSTRRATLAEDGGWPRCRLRMEQVLAALLDRNPVR